MSRYKQILLFTMMLSLLLMAGAVSAQIHCFEFSEGSGTETEDDCAGNNVTVSDMDWDSNTPIYGVVDDGEPYSALINDSTDITFTGTEVSDVYSFSVWFYIEELPEGDFPFSQTLIQVGQGSNDRTFLSVSPDKTIKFQNKDSSPKTYDSTETVQQGWNHVVAVRDETSISMRINNETESGSLSENPFISNDGWSIGSGFYENFNGSIDSVKAWSSTPLSNTETENLYECNQITSCPEPEEFDHPEAYTEPSSDITSDSAVMNGNITPNDALGQEVSAYFQLKMDNETDYTQTTTQVINTSTQTTYNTTVTGLESNTTYNNSFCIDYDDDTGTEQTTCGETLDFTTSQPQHPEINTEDPYDVANSSAMVQGNITENDATIDLAYFNIIDTEDNEYENIDAEYENSTDTYYLNYTDLSSETTYNYSLCSDYTLDGESYTECGDDVSFTTSETTGVVSDSQYLYYDFNEGEGSSTEDQWGDLDGTLFYPSDGTDDFEWINSTPSFNVSGNGDPHAVDLGHGSFVFDPDINTTEISVSFWTRRASAGDDYPPYFFFGDGDTGSRFELFVNEFDTEANMDYLRISMYDLLVEINDPNVTASNDYSSDWDHLVVTVDGESDDIKFYVNGQEHTDITVLNGDIDDIRDRFILDEQSYVGMSNTEDFNTGANFQGDMDEFKVYTEYLTEEDVQSLYDYGSVDILDENETYYPPEAITTPATNITSDSALFNGEVSVNDNAGDTLSSYFEYKTENETDYTTTSTFELDTNETTTASYEQDELSTNTSYDYRYCIEYENDDGDIETDCGLDETFTTTDENGTQPGDDDEELEGTLDSMWDTLLQGSSTAKTILGIGILLSILFLGVRTFGENNVQLGTYGIMILVFVGATLATLLGLFPTSILILFIIGGVVLAVLKGLLMSGNGGE